MAIVGESGSGKSVEALSILRLIPDPPGRIVSGEVLFDGRDLRTLSEEEMRKVRGRDIGFRFVLGAHEWRSSVSLLLQRFLSCRESFVERRRVCNQTA